VLPLLGLLAGADALLTEMGLPPPERPLGVRIVGAVIVAAPPLLGWLSPLLYRLPGLAWLADRRPMSLTLDATGMTLRKGDETQAVRWDDVTELGVFEGGTETASAWLVLRDRSHIDLPGEFALPRRVDGTRTTLLDEIEVYRPQLSRAGERRRQHRRVSLVLMGIVSALGLIALYLLYGP
jgi:hypothetical protein